MVFLYVVVRVHALLWFWIMLVSQGFVRLKLSCVNEPTHLIYLLSRSTNYSMLVSCTNWCGVNVRQWQYISLHNQSLHFQLIVPLYCMQVNIFYVHIFIIDAEYWRCPAFMHFQDLKCLPVDYPFHIAAYTERMKKYYCLFWNLHGLPLVSHIMQLDKPREHIYFIFFLG